MSVTITVEVSERTAELIKALKKEWFFNMAAEKAYNPEIRDTDLEASDVDIISMAIESLAVEKKILPF